MTVPLLCIGVSHRTAPQDVRERIAAALSDDAISLQTLRDTLAECCLLRTCGRCELYLSGDLERLHRAAHDWLARLQAEAPQVCSYARKHEGFAVARHLLRVAGGLESPLPGEAQILGQVRRAFERGVAEATVGPVLSALFRSAIHAGKRVRHETDLGRTAQTYADVAAAALAEQKTGRNVLVIGSGRLAEEVAVRLSGMSRKLTVAGRHAHRVQQIAGRTNAHAAALENLPGLLPLAHAAVTCTSAPRPLVDARTLRAVRDELLLIDLGMPRNVDPALAADHRVTLRSLSDLCPGGDSANRRAVLDAESIIDREHRRFARWLRARSVAPQIARLREATYRLDPETGRKRRRELHQHIRRLMESAA